MLKAKTIAVRRKQLLDRGPTWALTEHAGPETTVGPVPPSHVANRAHHFRGTQWEALRQTLFEDRSDLEWKPKEDLECADRTRLSRATRVVQLFGPTDDHPGPTITVMRFERTP